MHHPSLYFTILDMTFIFLLTLLTHLSQNAAAQSFPPGVIATGTMGTTNPPQATMGTQINQTSMGRLLSVNSISVGIFNYSSPSVKADTRNQSHRTFASLHPLIMPLLAIQKFVLWTLLAECAVITDPIINCVKNRHLKWHGVRSLETMRESFQTEPSLAYPS